MLVGCLGTSLYEMLSKDPGLGGSSGVDMAERKQKTIFNPVSTHSPVLLLIPLYYYTYPCKHTFKQVLTLFLTSFGKTFSLF